MNVWRLIAHPEDTEAAVKWTRREDKIALGWGAAGNLLQYPSAEEVSAGILKGAPDSQDAEQGGQQLWDFVHTMQRNDLVIVSTKKARTLMMQVVGDYEWSEPNDVPIYGSDYRHQRRVRPLHYKPDAIWRLAGGSALGYGVHSPLVLCKNTLTNADLRLRL